MFHSSDSLIGPKQGPASPPPTPESPEWLLLSRGQDLIQDLVLGTEVLHFSISFFFMSKQTNGNQSSQSAGVILSVGEDAGQQGRPRVVVVVQVEVECGRGRGVQVVCGQEHPAGLSQQLQTDGGLPLPLGPDGDTET